VAPQGRSGGDRRLKAIDVYALSWGVPRTPACNVAETAQRKSQRDTTAAVFEQGDTIFVIKKTPAFGLDTEFQEILTTMRFY
jgi:hypothetical protein